MSQMDIGSATASDLSTKQSDYSVDLVETDGISDLKETTYTCSDFSKWHGYYRTDPALRGVIDTKATWTIGKGFLADEQTTMMLDTIKGNGSDTFNTILENMIRTAHIAGDSFAEIVREGEQLINIKPLPPNRVRVHFNRQGVIIKYVYLNRDGKKAEKSFEPEDILHLVRNRVADEIHGVSMIEALEPIILAKLEAFADMKKLMHRHVKPMRIWKHDTDDVTKITTFKNLIDDNTDDAENVHLPMGTIEHELVAVPPNATLSPIPWLDWLDQRFYEAARVPKIIVGGGSSLTEASGKIEYLAFQQSVEEDQLYIQEQVLSQLNLVIELEFPASLENEMLSDKSKDVQSGAAQPSEMTAGAGE